MRSQNSLTSVAARIQAHPSRSHLWPALTEALAPLPVEVSVHSSDPPSPWDGYKKALTDPPNCSHLLVIQEDTTVCRNFAATVERIAAAKPDDPVCLFLSWLPQVIAKDALQAIKVRQRYIRARPAKFCPVVAVLWPVKTAERFIAWTESGVRLPGYPRGVRSDDAVLGEWIRRKQGQVWIALPSLVQHPDDVVSVKGRQNQMWGKDKGRVALHWIGPDADPLEFDWSD